jgi:hypothetical protein
MLGGGRARQEAGSDLEGEGAGRGTRESGRDERQVSLVVGEQRAASAIRARALVESLRRHLQTGYHAVPSFTSYQLLNQLDVELRKSCWAMEYVENRARQKGKAGGKGRGKGRGESWIQLSSPPSPHVDKSMSCPSCERVRTKVASLRAERDELRRCLAVQGGTSDQPVYDTHAQQLIAEYRRVLSRLSKKLATAKSRQGQDWVGPGTTVSEMESFQLKVKAANLAAEEAEIRALAAEARRARLERVLRDVCGERDAWEERCNQEVATSSALRLALASSGSRRATRPRNPPKMMMPSESPHRMPARDKVPGPAFMSNRMDEKISELTNALRRAACDETRQILTDIAAKLEGPPTGAVAAPVLAKGGKLENSDTPRSSGGNSTEDDIL